MGTPLGPKYIPYTYMDPLGGLGFRVQGFAQVWEGNDFGDLGWYRGSGHRSSRLQGWVFSLKPKTKNPNDKP